MFQSSRLSKIFDPGQSRLQYLATLAEQRCAVPTAPAPVRKR